ncbi:MAG: zinc ribbon domain-containing protein, partial [Alphaproteobacteria bacterium]|nr:zinc ribbon domain-containing protein [Alphaproteobacteria bacterium]
MADEYLKPVPRPAPESEPYWAAARDHKLKLQKCGACGEFWFPPSSRCPHCLDADHSWEEVSGTGRVFSFVTYQRLYHKGW